MSQPVGVIARFSPAPKKRSDLQTLLQGMVAPTRFETGCRSYDLYEAPTDGDFVLIESYEDQDALDLHRATEHYLNYRAHLNPLLASPVCVTVLASIDVA